MPPVQTPIVQAPPPEKSSLPIIIAVIVTAVVISGLFYAISQKKQEEIVVAPTPTPVLMPTPTPVRQPSALAAAPEFIQFKAAVATLSAAIAGYSSQDPSLTPPTLVLPLGF